MKLKAFFLILIFVVWLPGAWAGMTVSGNGVSTVSGGDIASSSEVEDVNDQVIESATEIKDQILEAGEAIVLEIRGQTGKMETWHNDLKETLRELLIQQSVADQEMEAQREFGEGSRPTWGCCSEKMSEGARAGESGTAATVTNLDQTLQTHADGEWVQAASSVYGKWNGYVERREEDGSPAGDILFPTSGTRSEEQEEQLAEIIQSQIMPVPPRNLPEEIKNIPEADNYNIFRQLYLDRTSITGGVLNRAVGKGSGNEQAAEWVNTLAQNSGATSGVVDGKASEEAIQDAMVDLFYGNKDWLEQAATAPSQKALRDLTYMAALSLKLQNEQLKVLNMIAAIMALQDADETRVSYGGVLQENYNNLMSVHIE